MLLYYLKRVFILLLFLGSSFLYAKMIDVSQKNISLLEHSEIYLDDDNLSLQEIINAGYFEPYQKKNVNIGALKKTVWVKLSFRNKSAKKIQRIILIYSLFLEHIDFYPHDNFSTSIAKGQAHFSQSQKTLYDYFSLSLEPNTTQTVYIKTYSEYVPLRFLITLEEKKTYVEKDYYSQIINIFLIGFIFALMLYSFILSLYIKDKSYLFYSIYLFVVLYDQSRFVGISHLFFSEYLMLFDLKVTIVRIYLLVVSSALFTMYFLQIPRASKIYKVYIAFIVLSFFSMVFLDLRKGFGMNTAFVFLLSICIYNLFVGIHSYMQGKKQARLYIVGFGIVFVSYVLIILDISGVIAMTQHYQNILLWTTAIEALILSLAFADRYILLQKEKENISTQYLKESQDRENIIEEEVERKTMQLNEALAGKEVLLKEVHHRVKNNLQIILSMIQLQHRGEAQDTVLADLENRVNAIAKTYDMLIVNDDLEYIDMKHYLEGLLLDIQESVSSLGNSIELSSEIEAILPLKEAVYVGIIVNEAVTNSYKYAFTNQQGSIEVSLKEEDNEYILDIRDTGVGFDLNRKQTSLGIKLIESLAVEQLRGKLILESKGKTHYIITFSH